MTVIAWDGVTLAADELACNSDLGWLVTKIFREGNSVVAFSGGYAEGLSLLQWYRDGESLERWPAHQSTDEWCRLVVARPGECYFYERLPIKQLVTQEYMAWGSGRDFAIGALHHGASAAEAVSAAINHCITCGGKPVVFAVGVA